MNFIINYWLEFLFGLVIMFLGFLGHRISRYYQNLVSSVDGVKVLLKAKIIEEYNMIRQNPSVSIYQKQVLLDLYHEYKKFGSDRFIDEIIDDINHMSMTNE